ncbi:nuclear transport factor 2 family protein [Acanthopleuribacter pedis]|uniref:Nuclear transport factor 2 family protein n=1 Tax=Acanthopleuribacter pedis TaxID=442870 RepID=A0A8J7U516_9BACT|nr:nuclear transport factor 2 family protein [Acanthopleuribacter pedis]MBO1320369.1 nuclear transport factor 2 family protein [Acanthopleuribacter pedis]
MRRIRVLLLLSVVFPVVAGEAEDKAAITQTVMNYVEGWYQQDAEKMASAMHPKMAKFHVMKTRKAGDVVQVTNPEQLTNFTDASREMVKDMPFKADITVLYQDERMAMVKLESLVFYDGIGLMKRNGEWNIVQVMWAFTEEAKTYWSKKENKPLALAF